MTFSDQSSSSPPVPAEDTREAIQRGDPASEVERIAGMVSMADRPEQFELAVNQLLAAAVGIRTRLDAAESSLVAERTRSRKLEEERDEATAWAASSENPAFDAGWAAGQKRANIDLQARSRELEDALREAAAERNELCRVLSEVLKRWECSGCGENHTEFPQSW